MFSYWSWQILLQLCAGSSPGSRKLPLFLSSGRLLENKGRINTYKTLRASCSLQLAGSRGREWKKKGGFLASWLSPQLTLAAPNEIFASGSPGEPITSAACRALRLVGRLWGFVWFSRSSVVGHGAFRGAQQLGRRAPGGAFVGLAAAAFWLPGERALGLESAGEIKIWHPRPAAPAETLSSPPSACSLWLLGSEIRTVRASAN